MLGPDDGPVPDGGLRRRPFPDITGLLRAALIAFVLCLTAVFVYLGFLKRCDKECYSVEALEVSQANGKAKGRFRVIAAPSSGIASDGYAGACLVFKDPHGAGCVHDSSGCEKTALFAEVKQNNSTAFAYCAPDKTCWYKISENHCQKSIYPGEGPYPTYAVKYTREADLSAVRQSLYPRGNAPAKIQARTIACLNGKFDVEAVKAGKARPPCALAPKPGEYREDFGDAALVSF